jgi:tetratricopeptide (TPR) repeat protein
MLPHEVGGRIGAQVMRTLGVCAVLWLGAGLAHAGPAEDCNQLANLDLQLRGCTAYIRLGKGSPENLATAYLNRANIYAQRTKYDRAFADYGAALALDPGNPLIAYNRGNAYFDRHQYERAIADFSRAIELDESFALAYFNRGLAEEELGDTAAAAQDYRRTLALDPTAAKAQRRLERLQSQ